MKNSAKVQLIYQYKDPNGKKRYGQEICEFADLKTFMNGLAQIRAQSAKIIVLSERVIKNREGMQS